MPKIRRQAAWLPEEAPEGAWACQEQAYFLMKLCQESLRQRKVTA
jgi:hypothetical protein